MSKKFVPPKTREFNGREINALMEDEDNIVDREYGPRESDGYETEEVVIKHADGYFYRFTYRYETEHGINPYSEDPDDVTVAERVVPKETVTIKYVAVKE